MGFENLHVQTTWMWTSETSCNARTSSKGNIICRLLSLHYSRYVWMQFCKYHQKLHFTGSLHRRYWWRYQSLHVCNKQILITVDNSAKQLIKKTLQSPCKFLHRELQLKAERPWRGKPLRKHVSMDRDLLQVSEENNILTEQMSQSYLK